VWSAVQNRLKELNENALSRPTGKCSRFPALAGLGLGLKTCYMPGVMDKLEAHARLSGGASTDRAIYEMVERELLNCVKSAVTLIDLGCGSGNFWKHLTRGQNMFSRYVGVDVVRYDGFPEGECFCRADLNAQQIPLSDGTGDVVVAIETIEHLENPRGFVRELVRLTKPGGWVFVTTPNQLNVASLLCLTIRREFGQFQIRGLGGYPAHITALLESDLLKIAGENELSEVSIKYSGHGRIPFTARSWPFFFRGRLFSDNLLMAAHKLPKSKQS
jgi:SAM-dependent methyltransferase